MLTKKLLRIVELIRQEKQQKQQNNGYALGKLAMAEAIIHKVAFMLMHDNCIYVFPIERINKD